MEIFNINRENISKELTDNITVYFNTKSGKQKLLNALLEYYSENKKKE